MSVECMAAVFKLPIDHAEKFVLLVLADHADHEGRNSWPAVATIAKKASLSERTVRYCLKNLRSEGYIAIEKEATWDSPATYRLLLGGAITASPAKERGKGCKTRQEGVQGLHPNHPNTTILNRPRTFNGVKLSSEDVRERNELYALHPEIRPEGW